MPAPNPDLPAFDPARQAPVKRALISVSDKSRLIDQATTGESLFHATRILVVKRLSLLGVLPCGFSGIENPRVEQHAGSLQHVSWVLDLVLAIDDVLVFVTNVAAGSIKRVE